MLTFAAKEVLEVLPSHVEGKITCAEQTQMERIELPAKTPRQKFRLGSFHDLNHPFSIELVEVRNYMKESYNFFLRFVCPADAVDHKV